MRRPVWLGLGLAAALGASACFQIAGYGDFEFEEPKPPIDPFGVKLSTTRIEQVDVLLVVDNSRGTANKHLILKQTIAPFLSSLVSPPCFDGAGATVAAAADGSCPDGSARAIDPVTDLHLGVITTSLGSRGSDTCVNASENDRGQLVARDLTGAAVQTYDGQGFQAWDPLAQKDPPGLDSVDELVTRLETMVEGVGELGCGFEAPLEAWYRFLVDPDPYDTVQVAQFGEEATLNGTDATVLSQRAAFLRPNSLLAVVMVTDENDCSFREIDGYFTGQLFQPNTANPFHLAPGTSECATDPNGDCCVSCFEEIPPGCDQGNNCANGPLSNTLDNVNVRCFDQKRRFGIDFLHPIDRYVSGITASEITDREGNVVPNPLLAGRDPGRVVLAGIAGVPWQDLARLNESGQPDLISGLDPLQQPVGGFKSAQELAEPVAGVDSAWALLLGDPPNYVAPADPFMIESIDPRSGTHPLTGDAVVPSTAMPNDINQHEYTIAGRDDLQYACTFRGRSCDGVQGDAGCKNGMGQACGSTLDCAEGLICAPDNRCAVDCAGAMFSCPCIDPGNDSPVCGDVSPTLQYADYGRPAVRPLQVIQGVGAAGAVGSICPLQVDDASMPGFGYLPAMQSAVIDRLSESLKNRLCLDADTTVPVDGEGTAECVLLEATQRPAGECACDEATGRRFVGDELQSALDFALADPEAETAGWNCFCEVIQAPAGLELDACNEVATEPVVTASGKPVNGWCFVDGEAGEGNPDVTAVCPEGERRLVRTVGASQPPADAVSFLYCGGS